MRRFKLFPVAALLAPVLILLSASAVARGQAEGLSGNIHGHVTDPVGVNVTNGIVTLSTDGGKTAKYTFNTDASGDYKGSGIAVGTYTASLRNPDTPADKVVDQLLEIKITAGADTAADFDMTREDYLKKMTPEQRKAAEELKQKNASALKENSVIKNLNASLVKAREDDKNKNYAEADSLMTQVTQAKPEEAVLWFELGVAKNGEQKYDEAITALKKAIDLNAAAKKPDPQLAGGANNELASALTNTKKVEDAQAAYEAAAKADPPRAGMYYQNEAIVMTKSGNSGPHIVTVLHRLYLAFHQLIPPLFSHPLPIRPS